MAALSITAVCRSVAWKGVTGATLVRWRIQGRQTVAGTFSSSLLAAGADAALELPHCSKDAAVLRQVFLWPGVVPVVGRESGLSCRLMAAMILWP